MVRGSALVAAVAVGLVLAATAAAAAPTYILVSGPSLPRPVLLASRNENLDFMLAIAEAPTADEATERRLVGRPRLDLALFWNWSRQPPPTARDEASQHAWFYPAYRGQPAVINLLYPRLAGGGALRILARHGVPTRVSTHAPPAPQALRPCGSRGDGNKPQQLPSSAGARLGPLVIWPSVRTAVQAAAPGSEWAFVVKAPIVLPACARVTLAVPPEVAHLVAFQTAEGWVSSVRFEACDESTRAYAGAYDGTVGRYTGFPFAFALARRPVCVPLQVWIDGSNTPIQRLVPFGRRSCR
jgi:hypothetical protein